MQQDSYAVSFYGMFLQYYLAAFKILAFHHEHLFFTLILCQPSTTFKVPYANSLDLFEAFHHEHLFFTLILCPPSTNLRCHTQTAWISLKPFITNIFFTLILCPPSTTFKVPYANSLDLFEAFHHEHLFLL